MEKHITPELNKRVRAEVIRCCDIAFKLYGVYINPTITYQKAEDQSYRVAGTAWYEGQILYFNPWFLEAETEEFMSRTVPHEVAHLVIRMLQEIGSLSWKINVHGPAFREVMKQFGVPKEKRSEKHTFDIRVLPGHQMMRIYKCIECGHSHIFKPHQHTAMVDNPNKYGCVECDGFLKVIK